MMLYYEQKIPLHISSSEIDFGPICTESIKSKVDFNTCQWSNFELVLRLLEERESKLQL